MLRTETEFEIRECEKPTTEFAIARTQNRVAQPTDTNSRLIAFSKNKNHEDGNIRYLPSYRTHRQLPLLPRSRTLSRNREKTRERLYVCEKERERERVSE